MPTNYDSVDLDYTWNGDYDIDGGDLSDTSDDHIRALKQDVATMLASSQYDWENYPFRACGVDDWVGEQNSRRNAMAMKERIRLTLVSAGVVKAADLNIRIAPVHANRNIVVLGINALATQYNSLEPGTRLTIGLLFDTLEHQVTFLEKPLGAQQ